MDAALLARIQFGLTVSFHYIYPPLSIGLGICLVVMETIWLKTKDERYRAMTRFWAKIFGLTFAIGVATGIVMEFEFGTNWERYSRYVGDVFGSALAAEGIFAFFLESGFLAIVLFGWRRVRPLTHWFATLMVCLGAHFSAVWIIVANSWMQTPAGYHIVNGPNGPRAEVTDFWAVVFNPSSMERLQHTLVGAWSSGAFLLLSVGAWYLLKKKHEDFAKRSIRVGLCIALAASLLSLYTGSESAEIVTAHQPTKLAAMEGHFSNDTPAAFYVFGWVDMEKGVTHGLKIPGLLGLLAYGDANATIKGLDSFPKADLPPVNLTFQGYHAMIMMGCAMIAIALLGAVGWWRGWIWRWRPFLWVLVVAVLLPQLANQIGWMTAEIGRQPWIVWGLMRTGEGLSTVVSAANIVTSLVLFMLVYLLLFAVFVFMLNHKIKDGPEDIHSEEYGRFREAVMEITKGKKSVTSNAEEL
jgi:cytochrome bd ubiquinol oxidase subunit I